jgi:SAM-dependent methyltransferase
MAHMASDLLTFIERWLPPPPARVVDVGCGDGTLTRHLIEAGFRVTGIDPRAPAGRHFVRTTLERFEPGARFDAAVAVRALHHVEDSTRAVHSLFSLLRPKARLVLVEFAVEHVDAEARRWLARHQAKQELDTDFHGVIPLADLQSALAERFRPLALERTAYLAREIGRHELHGEEEAAIGRGELKPVGALLAYERT